MQPDPPHTDAVDPGLCARCAHVRRLRSDRGSTFYLCRRGADDPAFPRYPRLPVTACAGFAAAPADGAD